MLQVILMTSDKQTHMLPGFFHLWQKYYQAPVVGIVVGMKKPAHLPEGWRFVSQGKQEDFPASRWSERLEHVLDHIADDVFMLLLEDYYLLRQVDTLAIKMLYDYMHQFQNVLKIDLATDRLFSNGGGQYLFGYNTYETCGYLDLIKSDHTSDYHMSLWGGLWRNNLLRKILVPNESAQEIELNGTPRLAAYGDEILVLGTRQAPLRHINAIQGSHWNLDPYTGVNGLKFVDQKALNNLGYTWNVLEENEALIKTTTPDV